MNYTLRYTQDNIPIEWQGPGVYWYNNKKYAWLKLSDFLTEYRKRVPGMFFGDYKEFDINNTKDKKDEEKG